MFKTNSLTPDLLKIITDKLTEQPFTGVYTDLETPGTYLCRQCGIALFRSHNKFHSQCGWPSFDESLYKNVLSKPDADGHRVEIICARCNAHLGHVFSGENFTHKNMRFCVNSASLDFVEDNQVLDTEEAIFAAGCFWGVEYYFKKLPGVLKVVSGYTGGNKKYPTYKEICVGNTGHYEAIRIIYDYNQLNYEQLVKYFFEIHDPTQENGQGPDIGAQYRSAIFYYNNTQEKTAKMLVSQLEHKGYNIKTHILPVSIFWPAEEYHQSYYAKNQKTPYCHKYMKRF